MGILSTNCMSGLSLLSTTSKNAIELAKAKLASEMERTAARKYLD